MTMKEIHGSQVTARSKTGSLEEKVRDKQYLASCVFHTERDRAVLT